MGCSKNRELGAKDLGTRSRGLMKSPSQAVSLEKKDWTGCHLLVRDPALHSGLQGDLSLPVLKAEFRRLPKLLAFCSLDSYYSRRLCALRPRPLRVTP